MALMDVDLNPRQAAFAGPDSTALPSQDIDVDRLVWDREYRDEIRGQLKEDGGNLA